MGALNNVETPQVQGSSAMPKIFCIFASVLSILSILLLVLLVNHLIIAMILPVSPFPSTVEGRDHRFKFIKDRNQQFGYEKISPANIGFMKFSRRSMDQEMALPPSCFKYTGQNNSAPQDFVNRTIAGIRHGDVEVQWFQGPVQAAVAAVIKWHPLSQYSPDDSGCHMHSPAYCGSPVMALRGGQSKVPVVPLSKIELRHSEDPRLSIGHFRDICEIISLMPDDGGDK